MNNQSIVRRVVLYGLAIALVALTTMAISIPNPVVQGYVNFGDSMIFALALLGGPGLAAVAGGIGSALADLVLGYTHYVIPTLIIKGLEGLIAGVLAGLVARRLKHILTLVRAVLGLAAAGLWMVLGYYLTAALVFGLGFSGPLAGIPGDLVQAGVSIPVGLMLAGLLSSAGADRIFKSL